MSDCPGVCPLNGNPDYPLHCPDCADNEYSWLPREYSEKVRENAQLRAHLAQAEDALALARIVPEGACAICHQPFTERHEGAVMADDHGHHCHPSCWYQRQWLAMEAQLAQRTAALREMMVVYAGIGHGAGWEIAPENRQALIAAAEQACRALADLPDAS